MILTLGEKTNFNSSRLEEIRGLFVLGLLAVVVSIRIQNSEIIMNFHGKGFEVSIFLDVMIFLWSFYAFFMVLGQSTDMFEEKVANAFKQISKQLLLLSFIILSGLSTIYFYNMYPTRAPWVVPFVLFGLGYYILKKSHEKIVKSREKISSERLQLRKSVLDTWTGFKDSAYQYLLSACFVCLILVIYGTYEKYVIPASIIGAICLVLFLFFKDRKNK